MHRSPLASQTASCGLTIHSSRPCFARRLNSSVRPHGSNLGNLAVRSRATTAPGCSVCSLRWRVKATKRRGLRACPGSFGASSVGRKQASYPAGRVPDRWLRFVPISLNCSAGFWCCNRHLPGHSRLACAWGGKISECGLTMRSSRSRFVPQSTWQVELAMCFAPLRVSA